MLDLVRLHRAQGLLHSCLHAAGKVVAALTHSLEDPLARVLVDLCQWGCQNAPPFLCGSCLPLDVLNALELTFLSTCRQASNRLSVPSTRFVLLDFRPCLLLISAEAAVSVSQWWGGNVTLCLHTAH